MCFNISFLHIIYFILHLLLSYNSDYESMTFVIFAHDCNTLNLGGIKFLCSYSQIQVLLLFSHPSQSPLSLFYRRKVASYFV
jgi:hypothetical protein